MVAVSAAIFLCPLYIQTRCPCLTEELPKKPELIGHRGAPMVSVALFSPAPRGHAHAGETLMSYSSSFITISQPLFLYLTYWRTRSCTITNIRIFILSKHGSGMNLCPICGLVQRVSPMYMHVCSVVWDLWARVRLTVFPDRLQLAPENTMMSFNRSIACGVTAFETDVQLRYRGIGPTLILAGSGGALQWCVSHRP